MKENEQRAGQLIKAFLKQYRLDDKYTEREIYARWEELVGSAINNRTIKVRYNNGYLMVYLNSSTLRAELGMRKSELLERINQRLREKVVKDISFK